MYGKSLQGQPKIDPLIQRLKNELRVLNLLGKIWEILYIEGSTPDIGKRRENVIRIMLEKELGLKVNSAPSMEQEWDFSVVISEGEERKYSLKTTETITVIKVAWDSFPSIERAQKFEFKHPILYVTRTRNRKERKISIYVFDVDDLKDLKEKMRNSFWWIPRSGTNPRGYGISAKAVRALIKKAEERGNFVTSDYEIGNLDNVREKYWREWYGMLKKLASEV